MTDEELRQYRVDPEGIWAIAQYGGGDGYDRMETVKPQGWRAVPSWGRDGWDLGTWPLVVIYHREADGSFDLATNVEGDATTYRFPTRELRDAATDLIALFYWRSRSEDWSKGIHTVAEMPANLRGPFSWERLEREKKTEPVVKPEPEPIRVKTPHWNTSKPQLWRDDWRGTDVVIHFTGACYSCGRRTYSRSDGQNDPRGVLGDHADHSLEASEYDSVGPTVPLCAICANTEPLYSYALRHARSIWRPE
jgi:hypothetical protein